MFIIIYKRKMGSVAKCFKVRSQLDNAATGEKIVTTCKQIQSTGNDVIIDCTEEGRKVKVNFKGNEFKVDFKDVFDCLFLESGYKGKFILNEKLSF